MFRRRARFWERGHGALTIHQFVERLPPIRVNASRAEGVVDAAGELCCGSVNRLFRTDLALLAAVEGSQLGVSNPPEPEQRHAKRWRPDWPFSGFAS